MEMLLSNEVLDLSGTKHIMHVLSWGNKFNIYNETYSLRKLEKRHGCFSKLRKMRKNSLHIQFKLR